MYQPSRILIYGLLNPLNAELFYVGQTRKRREFWLLEQAAQHPDTKIQSQARAIVNLIGSMSHLEFRELLKESNG
ncbi:MAG: hypothetical protein JJU29_04150 [Verrucomicrobia bacterium]|nr:hypothetical protein [Verrucomicrobiota bacterium]MCH8511743.1 hypothetical protein [Kiritimatiellia bacterium]